jgi:hypothetical protein
MSRVNLSPGRLAVLVALVVIGIAVMLNGFGDDGAMLADGSSGVVETSPSETPGPTDTVTPSAGQTTSAPLEPQVDGVMIQVLNGTDAVGLAAQVEELLLGEGYESAQEAGDAQNKPVAATIVYFRTGPEAEQNEADAENLAKRFLKRVDATVEPLKATLDSQVAPKTALVVLIGEDYAAAHPVA